MPLVVDELVTRSRSEWLPRREWEDLVSGRTCPLCRSLAAPDAFGSGAHVVSRTRAGVLVLSPNQALPGYCVLYSLDHVAEPFELAADLQREFFAQLLAAARAIATLYRPAKVNYQILGNVVAHLHCHLIPRYHGDRAPGAAIQPDAAPLELPAAEHAARVAALRRAIEGEAGEGGVPG